MLAVDMVARCALGVQCFVVAVADVTALLAQVGHAAAIVADNVDFSFSSVLIYVWACLSSDERNAANEVRRNPGKTS